MVSAYDGCFRQNRHNEQRPLPIGRRGLGEQIAFDWKSASQLTSLAGTTTSPSLGISRPPLHRPAGLPAAPSGTAGTPPGHPAELEPPRLIPAESPFRRELHCMRIRDGLRTSRGSRRRCRLRPGCSCRTGSRAPTMRDASRYRGAVCACLPSLNCGLTTPSHPMRKSRIRCDNGGGHLRWRTKGPPRVRPGCTWSPGCRCCDPRSRYSPRCWTAGAVSATGPQPRARDCEGPPAGGAGVRRSRWGVPVGVDAADGR
jgi:hypothetical protein